MPLGDRKLERPNSLVVRYNIALLKGDQEQMDRAVGLAKGMRGAGHGMAHAEALALARSGGLVSRCRFTFSTVQRGIHGSAR